MDTLSTDSAVGGGVMLCCLGTHSINDVPRSTQVFLLMFVCFDDQDQRRMIETISHLTKMRFGEQEHNKAKDTKEVSRRTCGTLSPRCQLTCVSVSACRGHLLQAGGPV